MKYATELNFRNRSLTEYYEMRVIKLLQQNCFRVSFFNFIFDYKFVFLFPFRVQGDKNVHGVVICVYNSFPN
jgi:hypothetical protein